MANDEQALEGGDLASRAVVDHREQLRIDPFRCRRRALPNPCDVHSAIVHLHPVPAAPPDDEHRRGKHGPQHDLSSRGGSRCGSCPEANETCGERARLADRREGLAPQDRPAAFGGAFRPHREPAYEDGFDTRRRQAELPLAADDFPDARELHGASRLDRTAQRATRKARVEESEYWIKRGAVPQQLRVSHCLRNVRFCLANQTRTAEPDRTCVRGSPSTDPERRAHGSNAGSTPLSFEVFDREGCQNPGSAPNASFDTLHATATAEAARCSRTFRSAARRRCARKSAVIEDRRSAMGTKLGTKSPPRRPARKRKARICGPF
jgi:hypothetical protein